jgi:hypothetical protein
MNNAFDLDAVRDGLIEDQVLLEMPDSPHSQGREFLGLTPRAEVRRLRKFEEGATGFSEEAASRAQAAIFADISEMPNEVAPSGRPHNSSAHASLSLLPGTHEGKPGALDFSPIAVLHFRSFSAGLGLFDESIHALLPMRIHGHRRPIAIAEAQKEFGSFLKELFAAGELPALNGLIDPFLELGWQGNVYHAFLHAVFYAKGCHFSPSDFMPQATKVDPMVALRHE